MLDILLQHLPSFWTLAAGIAGGGLFAALIEAYQTFHKQSRLDDAQGADMRSDRMSEQSKRIDSLLDRMTTVEERQEEERKKRIEAEVRNRQLQATIDAMSTKINQLVKMVEDLREEAGMEPLTDEEKEDLKDTPDFTSNTDT